MSAYRLHGVISLLLSCTQETLGLCTWLVTSFKENFGGMLDGSVKHLTLCCLRLQTDSLIKLERIWDALASLCCCGSVTRRGRKCPDSVTDV
jgi:hypothetical protein